MLGAMLRAAGRRTAVLGNIGEPLVHAALEPDRFDVLAVELSSFQLHWSSTLAPEAGTERLRFAINKLVRDEDLYNAVENAFANGWNSVKMYFMVGLPTETMEDINGIVELGRNVKAIGKRHIGNRARFRVSTSNHVPKPHTPFQWAAQDTGDMLRPKHEILRDGCRIHLSCSAPTVRDQAAFEADEHLDACFVVTGAAALSARFAAAGAPFSVPLRTMPYGTEFYVRDPDGYILGFVEAAT